MKTDETQTRRRTIALVIGGIATVLIAGVIGLSVGESAAPEQADPTLTTKETFTKARKEAIAEVKEATAEQGFKDGRRAASR